MRKNPNDNTMISVASALHYKTPVTIKKWFVNGAIPKRAEVNLLEFLKGKNK